MARGGTPLAWPLVGRAEISTKRVNVDIVYRFAEGHLDRFPVLAVELVGLSPDVILAAVTPAEWRRSADHINSDCLPLTRRRHQLRPNC